MTSRATNSRTGPSLTPFPRCRPVRGPATFGISAMILTLALALPSMAAAGDVPAPPQEAPVFGVPLAADALETLRGGDQVESKVDLHGTVEGNSAEDIVSGDNRVQGGAFGNAAGINTLIQNTGSNVLIQNGMTVNVQFADPGMP